MYYSAQLIVGASGAGGVLDDTVVTHCAASLAGIPPGGL